MLSTIIEGARPLAIDRERSLLRIGFPSGATFNKRKAETKANVEQLADSVKAIVGERLLPRFELIDCAAAGAASSEAAAASEMADDEIIELLKTKFDAHEVFEDQPEASEGEAQSREAG